SQHAQGQPAPRRASTANPHTRSGPSHSPEPPADRSHLSRFLSEQRAHCGDCARSGRYGRVQPTPTAIRGGEPVTPHSETSPATPLTPVKRIWPTNKIDAARRTI